MTNSKESTALNGHQDDCHCNRCAFDLRSAAILRGAERMAASATNGTFWVHGQNYTLTFDRARWLYEVTDETGASITNFNTKSLKQARAWLREYLSN